MPPNDKKKLRGSSLIMGVRLVALASVVVTGLAAALLISIVVKFNSTENDSYISKTNRVVEPCNRHDLHKKQGPYAYGQGVPYPNVTFTPATLTVTLTTTSVTTETITPLFSTINSTDTVISTFPLANSTTETAYGSSLSSFPSLPTGIITVTHFGTIHVHTATDSHNLTLASSTVDAQTNSVISSSNAESSATMANKTDISSTSNCTNTQVLDGQSLSTQVSELITLPTITVTTTISYSALDSEEYTGTETITVTPRVTITKGTTITLSSTTETQEASSAATQKNSSADSVTVTVTVYLSQLSTQAQTGAVGISGSAGNFTALAPVTATVVQTVSPVPGNPSGTKCTKSVTSGSSSVYPMSHLSVMTVPALSTSTVLTTSSTAEAPVTVKTITSTTTITLDVDTTCTTSSAAIDSTYTSELTVTTGMVPSINHTPYPVSHTSHWSIEFNTSIIAVGTVTLSLVHVTTESATKHTASIHTPSGEVTGSYATAYPANTSIPVSSGAGSDEKPPCSLPWGGGDGGGSRTCVVMLAVVISLVRRLFRFETAVFSTPPGISCASNMSLTSYLAYFLAGYTGLVVAFYMLSTVVPKAAFVARALASYIALIICAAYGVIASIVLRILGRERIAQWAVARAFKYVMALLTGITFEVEDPNKYLETVRPAVFIGNHQTELDVLMLGCMFPKYCSVTAKKNLKSIPILGWFMTLSGTIFIDRASSKNARDAMAGAAEEIQRRKQSVYMFPEGTRSYAKEPGLLPFKKGAFHLAVQAGVPIVPVIAANYSHILHIKSLAFNGGKIPVKVLDPIPTTGLTAEDVDELTRSTRELMLQEITRLTQTVRKHPIAVPMNSGSGVVKVSGRDAA
ncbi:hypothetical protein NUW58_g3319 [Xylaria curta]|uniref:Uncharacterized protein n=1 Tax=Xylaria curta TaxID=42375 RepID=A0ACC1PDW5_9PEZI|nr:hypothetical protein NUW58_g3319 [Xylaria curta]